MKFLFALIFFPFVLLSQAESEKENVVTCYYPDFHIINYNYDIGVISLNIIEDNYTGKVEVKPDSLSFQYTNYKMVYKNGVLQNYVESDKYYKQEPIVTESNLIYNENGDLIKLFQIKNQNKIKERYCYTFEKLGNSVNISVFSNNDILHSKRFLTFYYTKKILFKDTFNYEISIDEFQNSFKKNVFLESKDDHICHSSYDSLGRIVEEQYCELNLFKDHFCSPYPANLFFTDESRVDCIAKYFYDGNLIQKILLKNLSSGDILTINYHYVNSKLIKITGGDKILISLVYSD